MKATDLAIYKVMRRINNTMLGHTKNVSKEVKYAEWLDARRLAQEAEDLVFAVNMEEDANLSFRMCRTLELKMYGVKHRVRRLSECGYLPVGYKTRLIIDADDCIKQAHDWGNYFKRKARTDASRQFGSASYMD